MAELNEIDLTERLFLKSYPFHHYAPRASDHKSTMISPLAKPLAQSRVALVTTAGLSLPDQPPFDTHNRLGDSSFRRFPGSISPQLLQMHHRSWSFDQTGILQDRNLVMPLDRLHEAQQRGEIGQVADFHYSFMGSIVGPRKLMKESAPQVAQFMKAEAVDVAFLTPV